MPVEKKFFHELIEHWKALPKSGGRVPLKTTFSPMRVHKMLPNLYFSERLEKYHIQLKLVGEKLEVITHDLMPSKNVFDIFSKSDWDEIEAYYDHFCGWPCAGHMIRSLTSENGLVYDVETLGLPLADKKGNARFIFGLVRVRHNQAKSLLRQNGGEVDSQISTLEYWDLGYGTPKVKEYQAVKRVNGGR